MGRLLESGKNIRVVCFMDESKGADRLVAMEDIRNIADLKGKRVGFAPHGPGIHLLSEALVAAGLKMDDVEEVSLLPPDIPGALMRGEVSAVVAADPWVRTMVDGGAHILIDSSELKIPGLRMLVVNERVLSEQRDKVVDLVRAHFSLAPNLQKAEDVEGMDVVLRRQRISRDEFAEVMSNIRIFDREENASLMRDGSAAIARIFSPVNPEDMPRSNRPAGPGGEWKDESIIMEATP